MPGERVSECLRRPIPGVPGVAVLYSRAQRAAHYGGLQVCGSVWMCPVCSAKISERRREELSAAVAAWSGQFVLVTLTLQHRVSDGLVGLLDDLQEAVRKMASGRVWDDFRKRYRVAGCIRSLEVTYGRHGFHPHQHRLYFLPPSADVNAFASELRSLFLAAAAKRGRYVHPRWGVDVRASSAAVAAYVAKWGHEPKWTVAHELAKSVAKRARGDGFSMLELLSLYAVAGDAEAGRLWREYALTFKGRKQLVWSRGLRALLGLVIEEKTDEEVAAEPVEDAELLALLDLPAWRIVVANDARGELLDVASAGDVDVLRLFLARLGVEVG